MACWRNQEEAGGDGAESVRREGGGEGKQGTRAAHAQPCGSQGGLGLLPGRMWASWRIVGSGGAGPDAGAFRRPLVAAAGKTDHEGIANVLVQVDAEEEVTNILASPTTTLGSSSSGRWHISPEPSAREIPIISFSCGTFQAQRRQACSPDHPAIQMQGQTLGPQCKPPF